MGGGKSKKETEKNANDAKDVNASRRAEFSTENQKDSYMHRGQKPKKGTVYNPIASMSIYEYSMYVTEVKWPLWLRKRYDEERKKACVEGFDRLLKGVLPIAVEASRADLSGL